VVGLILGATLLTAGTMLPALACRIGAVPRVRVPSTTTNF
jgi:hypothetical protein